jgi:hypothetical protein
MEKWGDEQVVEAMPNTTLPEAALLFLGCANDLPRLRSAQVAQ